MLVDVFGTNNSQAWTWDDECSSTADRKLLLYTLLTLRKLPTLGNGFCKK